MSSGMILGGLASLGGIRSGPQATGQLATDIEFDVGITHEQRLSVGVDGNELNTAQPGLDHSVDGVHPTAADTNDLYNRQVVLRCACHDRHSCPRSRKEG